MGDQVEENQHIGNAAPGPCYFVTSFDGDILTGVDDKYQLEWTNTALLQETGKRAVTFRNPYQIPAPIGRQLSSSHQVFRISHPVAEQAVFLNEVLGAEYIGPYKKYQSNVTTSALISGRGCHP